MTSILFLVAAVVSSLVGCAVFLLRHRTPTSPEHAIRSFAREMAALSPERRSPVSRRAGGPTPGPISGARPDAARTRRR